ncbi:hypothetical protein GCM10028820_14460 [Tessaracoccus terricola]
MAVLVAPLALLAQPLTAQAEVDIYTTPGTHHVNGREWRTTCEPYSQTKRCRTEIKATTITFTGGRYVSTQGWVFNNLTYAASSRALWERNPLGANGVVGGAVTWTGDDGRQWRTECDTALTGRHGCRSFARADVIERTDTGYRRVNKWVFNNMVRFTIPPAGPVVHPKAPPMTTAPAFLEGRRHFRLATVVTLPNNPGGQAKGTARVANIELDPGGKLGTFRERYWNYTFDDAVEKDYGRFRTPIPNQPTGCISSDKDRRDRVLLGLPPLREGTCDVRTARTFLQSPTVRTGTYEAITGAGGNRIKLYWDGSGTTETYLDTTEPDATHSELRLVGQNRAGAVEAIGFMFGSTRAPGAGRSLAPQADANVTWVSPRSVDADEVDQSPFPTDAGGEGNTLWVQTVGSPELVPVGQGFHLREYIATGAGCIVTPPESRGRSHPDGWHAYMCPLPDDGRMVWHHMVAWHVAEGHELCTEWKPGTPVDEHVARCMDESYRTADYAMPARPGGHVYEALQIIDDTDAVVGMLGLETSLYSHKVSSYSQLGVFVAVAPR